MKRICIALAIAAIAFLALFFQRNVSLFIPLVVHWVNAQGVLAPIFFVLLYALATLLFLPTMIFSIAGGAIFGPLLGTAINLLGSSIGAICAFQISRNFFFNKLSLRKNSRTRQMVEGVEKRGWQFVALLRLIPIIPFNIVNYGLGLTRIQFRHYIWSTVLFLIPLEILSTYFGYASLDVMANSNAFYVKLLLLSILVLGLLWFVIILIGLRWKGRSGQV